jgi:four helix bundle protein
VLRRSVSGIHRKFDLDSDIHHIASPVSQGIFERMQCSVRPIVKSYRDLVVWKKAMALVLQVYRSTQAFPKIETYGLVSQLRRAAVSVPSNIAEGQARISTGEFRQFLGNARGSLTEVETQILIAQGLGYLQPEETESLLGDTAEVGRILNGLLSSLPMRR